MKISEKLKQKTEDLEKVGKEINQLQATLQTKQIEAIRLDGAISQLKELESESS